MKLNFYGPNVKADLEISAVETLDELGEFLVARIREEINVLNVTTGPRGGVHYIPSAPGTPPHRRTGNLIDSIIYQVNKTTFKLQIGCDSRAKYGKFLELGTKKMVERPFASWALNKYYSLMQEIATRQHIGI